MKYSLIFTVLFIFVSLVVNAQKEFKKSLNGITRVEVETGTSVRIMEVSSREITISEGCNDCGIDNTNSDRDKTGKADEDERAKGLKAIYSTGEDNTGVGMFMQQDGEVLKVKDLKTFWKRKGLTITLPPSVTLSLDSGNLGNVFVDKWTSELEINTNVGDINLKNVTGPVTAHSSTGNIEVLFSTVNQDAPVSISSSTGTIDVSLPANTKASVELKSTTGIVYSNFSLVKPREDGLKPLNGNKTISGELNGSGIKISLKASTGNIYLRKK